MNIDGYISGLINYAKENGLIAGEDEVWAINGILDILKLQEYESMESPEQLSLEELLDGILDYAVAEKLIEDSTLDRDLLDTKIMGFLTPRPSEVIARFNGLKKESPEKATDWYYSFSKASDYIRTYRIKKDLKWKAETVYGDLDITINLSKPEKDPKAIAAALSAPQSGYPKCQLCREAEGYAGNAHYPARENHRIIPIELNGENFFLQYSPYVYYNEHCIVLNEKHIPMKIDDSAFAKLLDFETKFPHYFIGSNADLPIVGGSILSHDHFQGGRYEFPMQRAETEDALVFKGFEDVNAGILNWPMSAIRIRSADKDRLRALATIILKKWRTYSDETVGIFAETDGVPHNTITPICRRRGGDYEMDLVLRNNLTSEEHPLGIFHPHAELHHIKKENIGLIEVMGLAILPSRLKTEMKTLAELLAEGADLRNDPAIGKHVEWAEELREKYTFTRDNAEKILQKEIGLVFAKVLEHAGVFKRDEKGREAFLKFTDCVNR